MNDHFSSTAIQNIEKIIRHCIIRVCHRRFFFGGTSGFARDVNPPLTGGKVRSQRIDKERPSSHGQGIGLNDLPQGGQGAATQWNGCHGSKYDPVIVIAVRIGKKGFIRHNRLQCKIRDIQGGGISVAGGIRRRHLYQLR